jgi:hypothetical protein
MEPAPLSGDLAFRVGLLERAISESRSQLDELRKAVVGAKNGCPSDEQNRAQLVQIDADAVAPFAAGFYFKETDAHGRPYRWTGRSDFFELRFYLNRDVSWTFELEFMANPHVDVNLMRAFVDYAEVPLTPGETGIIRGPVPTRPLCNFATITFYLPSRFVPRQLDPSSDDGRSLGIVFYRLSLRPEQVGV